MIELEPANELERRMLAALDAGDQDGYLHLLADAELVMPDAGGSGWATVVVDGRTFIAAYTSDAAMAISTDGQFRYGRRVTLRELVASWPDPAWSLVIDPGLPLAAHLPATLLRQIDGGEFVPSREVSDAVTQVLPRIDDSFEASFRAAGLDVPTPGAFESGFGAGYDGRVESGLGRVLERACEVDEDLVPTVMQKVIPPDQVAFYLDKGYDWVAGYVHRWQDAAPLTTAADLIANLGLSYPGSPFSVTDPSVYLLRWTAYRAELYRTPLGATDAATMADIPGGWVVEHPPFSGTGHVSGSRLSICEYKIDSIRLPHQAEMWRVTDTGEHHFVAVYDADEQRWLVNRDLVGEL